MKKLLVIVVLGLLIWSSNAYSKMFTWTCLKTPSKDFQKVYEINDIRKTVKHLTSYDFQNKKRYEVNKFMQILKFEKNHVWASYGIDNWEDAGIAYMDLKNNRILQSTILPKQTGLRYQSLEFDCFISN